ncbi:MAG: hypothetical protein R6V51_03200 [Dehalococcoidia bacterium]
MNKRSGLIVTAVGIAAVLLAVLLPRVLAARPPEITALQAASERVFPSESTEIVCDATHPDGVEPDYKWQYTGGSLEGEGAIVVWTAPATEGFFYIEVTVSDQRGNTDTKQIMIISKANVPPTILGLTADAGWTLPGGSLRITCEVEDPDGDELSYLWTATGGGIIDTGTAVTWTAPADVGEHDITVVVDDGHGGSDTRSLHVSVVTGQPPVVESLTVEAEHKYLRETASTYEVGEGRDFRIHCVAAHPDDLEFAYEWKWEGGEIVEVSEDGATITWTAPYTRGELTITVTVTDIHGNMISRSVQLEVVSCSRFG